MCSQTHRRLTKLAQLSARYDFQLGRMLLAGLREQVHDVTGYASFADYCEAMFGLEPRYVAARVRVAAALEQLPLLAAALCDGLLRWSVVRELTRVAGPGTESGWIDYADRHCLDDVRVEVRRLTIGNDSAEIAWADPGVALETSGPLGKVGAQCEKAERSFLMLRQPEPTAVAIR